MPMSKRNLSPQRARERGLFLYRNAVTRGDFETVAYILHLAARDPVLEQMITEADALDMAALNSSPPSFDGWLPTSNLNMEGTEMYATLEEKFARKSPYRSRSSVMMLAVAMLIAVLSGLIVMLTLLRSGSNLPFGPLMLQAVTPTPQIADCQLSETPDDAAAESRRLAEAATALLDAEGDADLAVLLGICALQTAYTQEADLALQLSTIRADVALELNHSSITDMAFTPDGQYVISGSSSTNSTRVWNLQTRATVHEFPNNGYVLSMALSPDGSLAAVGGSLGTVRVWSVQTGEEVRSFVIARSNWVTGVGFSPDGTLLVAASQSGSAIVWEVSTGMQLFTLTDDLSGNPAVKFSPDGEAILVVTQGLARLFSAETGTQITSFETAHQATGFCCRADFSPDGRYIAIVGAQTTDEGPGLVQVFDAETGDEEYRLEGHSGRVYGVAFSPDSRYLATASIDPIGYIFDLTTGERVRSFTSPFGQLTTLAFAPDESEIAVGQRYDSILLWPTDYRDMITYTCQQIGRDFTDVERTEYEISANSPTCPQFGGTGRYVMPVGMTPVPTQPIPVWTPIATPTLEQ